MAAQFDAFPSLSAELRATIWSLAARDEHNGKHCDGRQIELYNHDPDTESVSVAISSPYPTLFAVCREARYEVAKTTQCKWISIFARSNSPIESDHTTGFEICINFVLDTINLRTRFATPLLRTPLTIRPTQEQRQLEALARLLDYRTIQRIERIAMDAEPPIAPYRLDFDAWWKGEGLELFCFGRLQSVTISTREKSEHCSKDYARWLEAAVRDQVHDAWAERSQMNVPRIEVLSVGGSTA
ncbi:hypothetical protein C7974DRAFT_105215 [Boeremia exigua]|uniref:uncharacterized protein n=1 Tax=Boeremia exigua TaxID=749465 RepID=UPI001E8E9080|nr:uncharacterized protein C7974DRAFT_105215 [Boeremia exigua]KAH6642607.1 hypothetical protein C7974DRAFT_105215 [Boeremia exigua]